jgi:hypothetical protein
MRDRDLWLGVDRLPDCSQLLFEYKRLMGRIFAGRPRVLVRRGWEHV